MKIALIANCYAVKNSAFMACPELRELTISPSVKYIENYAFSNCVNLKKVTFEQGDDVLNIYEESFQKCPTEEINMGRYLSNEYLTKNLATLRNLSFLLFCTIISISPY